jgi:hypothetical protein
VSRASAAVVLLTWLALQALLHMALDRWQHPTTTPEEGNHA